MPSVASASLKFVPIAVYRRRAGGDLRSPISRHATTQGTAEGATQGMTEGATDGTFEGTAQGAPQGHGALRPGRRYLKL